MNRKPNNTCYTCSKPIYVRKSILEKSKSGNAFCSQDCYGVFCRKPVPCIECGAEILSGLNKKTCSRACANKQKIGLQYGDKLGRPTKDKARDVRTLKLRLVDHLGKNACEVCDYNKYPEVLQAHHIVERSKGGTDDLSNLQLLCPTCHSEEHHLRRLKCPRGRRGGTANPTA